jgi:hypothetical protein
VRRRRDRRRPVSCNLGWPAMALAAAQPTLEKHGDRLNAVYAPRTRSSASSDWSGRSVDAHSLVVTYPGLFQEVL